jgi:hypothetical protein
LADIERIAVAELRVLHLGGHRIIAHADGDGRLLRQINGLATTREGKPIAVGFLPSHRLKVHDSARPPGYWLRPAGTRFEADPDGKWRLDRQRGHVRLDQSRADLWQVVHEGTGEQVARRLSAMETAGEVINARDLPYPFIGMGPNSNSVASTLLAAAGLGLGRIARGASVVPFAGHLLLSDADLAAIRKAAGVDAAGPPRV